MGGGSIPMTAQKGRNSMYRTQKARGMAAGFGLAQETGNGYRVAAALAVLPHAEPAQIQGAFYQAKRNGTVIFARPCPIVPRHGFVESRPVANEEELQKVYEETIAEEPLGEVILMERLSGKYSAVMTAAGVAWGRDNDGVTAGKGDLRIVPSPHGRFDEILLPMLGIDPTKYHEGVYVELVEDGGIMCVVQMRLGPKQPDSRVKRVLHAPHIKIKMIVQCDTEDLILWDKKLRALTSYGNAKCTLVWLPGQSLSSHFAVQAISQGFNVSVEQECPVKVDGVLRQDTSELTPLGAEDLATLAHYVRHETNTIIWDYPRECLLSVAVLHAMPYWGNEDYLLKLRARGIMAAARFALSACLGESRHKPMMPDPSTGELPPQVPWKDLMGDMSNLRHSRGYVFLRAFSLPWDKCATYAKAAAADMILPSFGSVTDWLNAGKKLEDAKTGYRGPKWEWAALKCHDLIVALDKFVADPSQSNWGVCLGLYNEVINAAHNGDYLFTKWVSHGLIDNVASSPALAFGYQQVMNAVWGEPGSLPGQAWLPLSECKNGDKPNYVVLGDGVLVHKNVIALMQASGLFTPSGVPVKTSCKCKYCMVDVWADVGVASLMLGKPSYVPVDKLASMPYAVTKKNDKVSKGMTDILTVEGASSIVHGGSLDFSDDCDEDKGMEEDEGAGECGECGATLEDGECPDECCPACPNFKDMEATFDQPEEEAKEPDNGKDVP